MRNKTAAGLRKNNWNPILMLKFGISPGSNMQHMIVLWSRFCCFELVFIEYISVPDTFQCFLGAITMVWVFVVILSAEPTKLYFPFLLSNF